MYYAQELQYSLEQRPQTISEPNLAARSPLRQPAPKSRAPDPFDGTREKYSTFVFQLSLLFQNDPIRYGSEGTQIRTAASYLTGGALGWFKVYHDEATQEIRFKTYAEFIKVLKAAYDDPDKRATAERKLLALRQNNKDCSTYHAEFSTYANVLEYDDRTLAYVVKSPGIGKTPHAICDCPPYDEIWSPTLVGIRQRLMYFNPVISVLCDASYTAQNLQQYLAVLASRICLDPCMQSTSAVEFAEKAVHRHLRFVLAMDNNAGLIKSTTPPELLVTEAIAELLMLPNKSLWKHRIYCFVHGLLTPGLVDKARMGGLGGRLLA